MARKPRTCQPGVPLHVVQRGNDKQRCFHLSADFALYVNCLHEYAEQANIDLHAYALMHNHVHLLVTPHHGDSASRFMQAIGRKYVRYFNDRHGRTGGLWEGRFFSVPVECERYMLQAYRYIELNPVVAGIVSEPQDWLWSSYRTNALGKPAPKIVPHPLYCALGTSNEERQHAYTKLCQQYLDFKKDANKSLPWIRSSNRSQVSAKP